MDALSKLEERLRLGDIELSGQRQITADSPHFENSRRRVDPTFFNHAFLMPLMCMAHTDKYPQTVARGGASLEHFTALMVSKRDVEKCFKPKTILRRAIDRFRHKPRITYHD